MEMTPHQALEFIREQGVVLEAGRGSVPSLAEAVANEPIVGSWWSHPKGKEIFALTRFVRDSDEILVCRAVAGKVTFIHRRLWPALVRLADKLPRGHLAQLKEEHTLSGRHVVRTVPFPDWVSQDLSALAGELSESEARAQLASLFA
jgi:hypothetical protein